MIHPHPTCERRHVLSHRRESWHTFDGDGFGGELIDTVCELSQGQVKSPLDCDDADPAIAALRTCQEGLAQ